MITKEQATPGTKVKIPKTKTWYMGYEEDHADFIKELELAEYDLPYLVIRETSAHISQNEVALSFENQSCAKYLGKCIFSLEDLELYEEPNSLSWMGQLDLEIALDDDMWEPGEKEAILEQAKADAQFEPIRKAFAAMEDLLRWKNAKYGNSGLGVEPIVAPAGENLNKLLARLDDKLQRWRNHARLGNPPRREDVADVIGYCMLILADQQWYDMEDQKQ